MSCLFPKAETKARIGVPGQELPRMATTPWQPRCAAPRHALSTLTSPSKVRHSLPISLSPPLSQGLGPAWIPSTFRHFRIRQKKAALEQRVGENCLEHRKFSGWTLEPQEMAWEFWPLVTILGKVQPGLNGTNSGEERERRQSSEIDTTWEETSALSCSRKPMATFHTLKTRNFKIS